MLEISRFLGIVIAMYYRDHAPSHFHEIYGEYEDWRLAEQRLPLKEIESIEDQKFPSIEDS